ncbi:MAG: hypothetical protein AB1424_10940 [Thermodesulfobacteriota bacterium]
MEKEKIMKQVADEFKKIVDIISKLNHAFPYCQKIANNEITELYDSTMLYILSAFAVNADELTRTTHKINSLIYDQLFLDREIINKME